MMHKPMLSYTISTRTPKKYRLLLRQWHPSNEIAIPIHTMFVHFGPCLMHTVHSATHLPTSNTHSPNPPHTKPYGKFSYSCRDGGKWRHNRLEYFTGDRTPFVRRMAIQTHTCVPFVYTIFVVCSHTYGHCSKHHHDDYRTKCLRRIRIFYRVYPHTLPIGHQRNARSSVSFICYDYWRCGRQRILYYCDPLYHYYLPDHPRSSTLETTRDT